MRLCRVAFQFSADIGHIYTKNLVIGISIRSPDFLQDKVIRENLARIFGKQGYQLILDLGQVDIFSIQRHHPFIKVNDQAIPGVNRLTRTSV